MTQDKSNPIKKNRKKIRKRETVFTIDIKNENTNLDIIHINDPILINIGKIADENAVSVFIVGGFVRDYFLGRERSDYDLTVVGDADSYARLVASHYHSKVVSYPKFRTAFVPVGHKKLEFVGTRVEEYLPDSRKPIVQEGTLIDDLTRRDFTVNAMAAGLNKKNFGTLIDIFGGKNDIHSKILRTPLEANKTFEDDPLRMVRAARFASQLDFSIDSSIQQAISKMAARLDIISQERKTDEFLKILSSAKPSIGLAILHQTGQLKYIFTELDALGGIEVRTDNGREYAHKDILYHTFQVLDNLSEKTDNLWLRFAALVHDIAKPRTKRFIKGSGWTFHGHEELGAKMMKDIFKKLKLPFEYLPYVENLVRLHQRPMVLVDDGVSDSAVRRLAFNAGEALEDLFLLCRSDITTNNPKLSSKYLNNYDLVFKKVMAVQEKDKLREFQSPVRGDEIMKICNLKPSRTVGYIKTLIEEAILDGEIQNEYEAALEFFLRNKDEWLTRIKKEKR